MRCNLNCSYCYEANRQGLMMSFTVIQNIIVYLDKLFSEKKYLQNVRITWFGGEPLLYMNAIEKLSYGIMNLCQRYDKGYSAGIITNGRFLTKNVALKLKELKVKTVQLSFDGLIDKYCREKGASEQDFYETVQNIADVAEILPINIRVNFGADENIDDVKSLTSFFLSDMSLDRKIKIYMAFKRNYDRDQLMDHTIYLNKEYDYINWFLEQKYSPHSLGYQAPRRRVVSCHNICENGLCISNTGDFYKCEHCFGNEGKTVGSVEIGIEKNTTYRDYSRLIRKQMCDKCKYLPWCMGGCKDDLLAERDVLDCERLIRKWELLKKIELRTKGGE